MNTLTNNVVYIAINQVQKAIAFCGFAQRFMPSQKRFGVIVWGEPGSGKNAVTDNIHEKLSAITGEKYGQHDVDLACASPEDFAGIPVPNADRTRANFLYSTPVFDTPKGVLRVDEIDRPARMETVEAFVKWAMDRSLPNSIPLDWLVLGLANGITDENTLPLDEHLRTRVCHLYVTANTAEAHESTNKYWESRTKNKGFLRWAKSKPLTSKDMFDAHAKDTGRTRDYALAMLEAYDQLKEQGAPLDDIILPCLAGVIGIASAVELLRCHELAGLPTLEAIMASPAEAVIPEDLSLRTKFINVLITETGNDCEKCKALIPYLARLPRELARYALDNLALHCPDIVTSIEYKKAFDK